MYEMGNTAELPAAVVKPDEVTRPSYPEIVTRDRGIAEVFWHGPRRKAATIAAGAALFASAGVFASESVGSGGVVGLDPSVAAAATGPLPAGVTGHDNCDTAQINFSSFPGHPNQLVPSSENVSSKDEAGTYNQGLFDKGNQGTNIDPAAAATFYALMGYPATNSATDNKSSVHDIFQQAFNQITPNNTKAARNFCDINESVTSQTVGYDSTAIAKEVAYTQISAVVGTDGHIDDISLKQVTNHSDTIGGVTYKLQNGNTAANFSGFTEVIIPSNGHGTIDVLGLLPTGNSNQENNQGASGQQQNGGASTTQVSTPNAGNSGPGGSSPTEKKGSAGGAGTQAEGTSTGLSGTGTSGPGGGGGSTPGTGNVPPTPTTTPETTPPTTPPTVPPTTTTTSPPTTTTTQPIKNPNPNPGGCTDPFDPTCQG